MPLDRQVDAVLKLIREAGNTPYTEMSASEARAAHDQKAAILDAPPVKVANVRDTVASIDGSQIAVRIYTPTQSERDQACVVWIHGGGHVVGSLQSYDSVCRRLAIGSDAVVVSVDYRLAPEHKFPAAVDDSFSALRWVFENDGALGIDPKRVSVAGDSAGGNLAAVAALMARDAGLHVRAQALIYPVTAPDAESPSHHAHAVDRILTRELILWFQDHYRHSDADRRDWRYAPLIAPDVSGVAPALVLVAGYDPLRDEGVAYAQRLMASGVEVRLSHYAGMVHAFFNMAGAIDAADRAMQEVCEFLKTHSR